MFLGESAQLPEEGVSSELPLRTHPELVTDSRGRNGASVSQCEAYFSESPEQESPSAKLAERKWSTGISSACGHVSRVSRSTVNSVFCPIAPTRALGWSEPVSLFSL